NFARMAHMADDGIEGLEAVAGDTKDGGIIGGNFAGGNQFLGDADRHAAGGFGENALVLGEQLDAFTDFVITDILRGAAGFLHGAQGVKAVRRCADGERFGDGVGLDRFEEVEPGLLRGGNGRATGGLGAVNSVIGLRREAEFGEFLVTLVDFGQERAGSHADDGVFGNAPIELLDDLVAHALGTFSVIRAHIDIDEGPAKFAGNFGAQAIDFIVMALDADDRGAVDKRVDDFSLLQIGGNKNVSYQTGGGGV